MEEAPPPLRCLRKRHRAERLDDDGVETPTSAEQRKVERSVEAARVLATHGQTHDGSIPPRPTLLRERHAEYLNGGLRRLSAAYRCLDASRPWLCYWILHSLDLLGRPVGAAAASDVCRFLARCQSPATGGFGGGPGQLAHLAPTYAAVAALCVVGTPEAYAVVDRARLLDFLRSVRLPDGSFAMHVGGEADVRGAYCAVVVASLTGVLDSSSPALFEGTAGWIRHCQNWEGGLGGAPGLEAHGGYTFCGAAAMAVLGEGETLDVKALLRWAVNRQMRSEGGFQGRCNKLVDGCYSFWQGGLLALIHSTVCGGDGRVERSREPPLEADILRKESNLSRDKAVFVEEESTLSRDKAVFVEEESTLSRDKTVFGEEYNLSRDKAVFVEEYNLSRDKAVFVEEESTLSRDKAVFGEEYNLSCDKAVFVEEESTLSRDKAVFVEEESTLSRDKTVFGEEYNLSRDKAVFGEEESTLSRDKAVFGDESNLSHDKAVFVEEESTLSRDKAVFGDESSLSRDKAVFVEEESNFSRDKAVFVEEESTLSRDNAVFVEEESTLSRDKAVFGGESTLSHDKAVFGDAERRSSRQRWLFDQQALQEYILLCCQDPAGGLVDKPGKARDFYHTCYCLSGLSVAQHSGNADPEVHPEVTVGQEENRLARTHPVYNMSPEKVARAQRHFKQLPFPASEPETRARKHSQTTSRG